MQIRCNHCMNIMKETKDNQIFECDNCHKDNALMELKENI